MKTAFIGLGAMGYPMAGHLAREHELVVWNRTADVAERHAREHGSHAAAALEECAAADVIVTILPTSREVDWVVDSVWNRLRPGQLWIDATSGDPVSSRATANRLKERSVAFVDAPVSGGTTGAEQGALTAMIGGSAEDVERSRPVVSAFAKKIFHVGDIGFGHAIKVITNTMMAANIVSATEGLLALKKMGFDLRVALEAVNAVSGRSNVTENLLPRRILDNEWPVTFKLSLHEKDIRIATDILAQQHILAPVTMLVAQLYAAAVDELGPDADYIEMAKFMAALNDDAW